jgi:hypothetical protein
MTLPTAPLPVAELLSAGVPSTGAATAACSRPSLKPTLVLSRAPNSSWAQKLSSRKS